MADLGELLLDEVIEFDADARDRLAAEDVMDFFTFNKGDYIVKGIASEDVSSAADILNKYEAHEIMQITENLSASSYSRHIKLVVK